MAFADRLRILRLEKNIDQKELGKIFNLSKQSISAYEKGKGMPNPETLEKMADYFGVTIDDLLGRQPLNHSKVDRNYTSRKYTDKEYELLEAIKDLKPDQLEAIINMAKVMTPLQPIATENLQPVPEADSISDIPYWHLRLQALRKERGLTIEEAASLIDPFLSPEKLQAYEDGREVVEPKYQDKLGKFYNVSWAFISGRSNKRLHDAGPAIGSLEAAHRTDDPTQPLPLAAERRVNSLKKKRGLYVEEEGEEGKE